MQSFPGGCPEEDLLELASQWSNAEKHTFISKMPGCVWLPLIGKTLARPDGPFFIMQLGVSKSRFCQVSRFHRFIRHLKYSLHLLLVSLRVVLVVRPMMWDEQDAQMREAFWDTKYVSFSWSFFTHALHRCFAHARWFCFFDQTSVPCFEANPAACFADKPAAAVLVMSNSNAMSYNSDMNVLILRHTTLFDLDSLFSSLSANQDNGRKSNVTLRMCVCVSVRGKKGDLLRSFLQCNCVFACTRKATKLYWMTEKCDKGCHGSWRLSFKV